MSTHRCIAGFCEWRGDAHAVSVYITPNGPAFYPANDVELGESMGREVLRNTLNQRSN